MPERIVQPESFLKNTQRDVSRYRLTLLSLDETNNRVRFQLWTQPPFRVITLGPAAVEGVDFSRHTVNPGEIARLDLIASRYYEDVNLWWVIATVNNIKNPWLEMYPGQQLLIPNRDDVIGTLTPEE